MARVMQILLAGLSLSSHLTSTSTTSTVLHSQSKTNAGDALSTTFLTSSLWSHATSAIYPVPSPVPTSMQLGEVTDDYAGRISVGMKPITPMSTMSKASNDSCHITVCPDRFPTAHFDDTNPHNYTFDELFKLQSDLWDAFLYPNNIEQAKMINSSFFDPDVIGRIDVTRLFVGSELNTEYIFGLFTVRATEKDAVSLIGFPYAYQFQKFTANQNVASVASLVYIYYPVLNRTLPMELDLWTVYDGKGKGLITEYDVTFRYWDSLMRSTVELWAEHIHAGGNMTLVQRYLAKNIVGSICKTHDKYCNGTNLQYSSTDECLAFLATKVRFGQPDEGGRNTVICRMIHQPMISFRPDVHCPHIGPTGGGMCEDSPGYQQVVLEPVFTISPFMPWNRSRELNNARKLGIINGTEDA